MRADWRQWGADEPPDGECPSLLPLLPELESRAYSVEAPLFPRSSLRSPLGNFLKYLYPPELRREHKSKAGMPSPMVKGQGVGTRGSGNCQLAVRAAGGGQERPGPFRLVRAGPVQAPVQAGWGVHERHAALGSPLDRGDSTEYVRKVSSRTGTPYCGPDQSPRALLSPCGVASRTRPCPLARGSAEDRLLRAAPRVA